MRLRTLNACLVLVLVFLLIGCSTPIPTSTTASLNATETPTDLPTLSPAPTDLPTDATLAPTAEVTASPTGEPSATPTLSETMAPAAGPTTPLRLVNVQACSQITAPGYYKLVNNIKTPKYDCFYIESNNVVLDCDHHSIEGTNFQSHGVFVRKYGFPLQQTPSNVEIKNCKIFHHRTGIFVGGANNVYVHHNDLSDNLDDTDKRRFGVFLGMSEGGGLRLDTVNGGRAEYNTANNGAIGIDVRDSERVTVRNNTTTNNSAWGISLINTSHSEISNNTARDNIRWCAWGNGTVGRGCDAGGIILQDGSSHNVVKGNTVSGDNGNGIFIKAHFTRCDDDNLIQGNRILNAVYNGIELGFCKGNRAVSNEITGSMDGILFGFDSSTEIRGNIISKMTNHGISSWNSRGAVVDGNQIVNTREGILFYWETWDPKQFSFLAPSPDQYASRDNQISNNTIRDNTVAGIHLLNSIQNRILNNTFANNGRNILLEGKVQGNVIPALTPGSPILMPGTTPTETRPPTLAAPTDQTSAQPTPTPQGPDEGPDRQTP